MSVPADARFKIEIVRSWDAIVPRWDALARAGAATPFQASAWLGNWYAILGKNTGIEPLIVVVTELASARDEMIIPLIRRTSGGVKHIEFADLWVTDYNAPLVHPDFDASGIFNEQIWPPIVAALSPADVINFTKMPLAIAGRPNPVAALRGASSSSTVGHVIALPDSWDGYLSTLSKDTRRTLKRRWGKFLEAEGVIRRIVDRDDADAVLKTLDAQQRSRLEQVGAKHVYGDPLYRNLYEHYALQHLADGRLALYALYVGPEIVATFFALANGSHCTLIRSSQSQDERWKPLSLGRLIMIQAMEDLHRNGCRLFDLSIGSHGYKDEFGVTQVPLAEFNVRLSWRAVPLAAKRHALDMLARHPRILSLAKSISEKVFSRSAA